MATYSAAQVSALARSAGFPDPDVIGEIAMAESSGRSDVVNSIGATGLLQILQPVHVQDHPTWTSAWLKDPVNNVRAGKVLFDQDRAGGGDGYAPWVSSKDVWSQSAAWKKSHGAGGTTATAADDPCSLIKGPAREFCDAGNGNGPPASGGDTPSLADTAAQLGRIAQAIAKGANWLANPANWVRIAYVAGGTLLALTSVTVIARPTVMSSYRALPVKGVRDVVRGLR